ncbi:single-strand selective monofunctional uracil DNA glycosylase [Adelges cooleyi]|uniref:single-strand selective monofunctional uracil DNA glycosylase n=1 Tax=Adelges cooleyi TaxID=133065 RepID=UPI00217FF4B8|nr:single-strand selective monofunctional uracil DNA glycosylase [Adelges cooleyi]
MIVSKYFSQQEHILDTQNIANLYLELENNLSLKLHGLTYGLDLYIYRPLEYASSLHKEFVNKYLFSLKNVLFLGMNPGPWGMCQTGIPFGEVNVVKNYLRVSGTVEYPKNIHPQKPVLGLDCKRKEVSGQRFWDLINHLTDGDPFRFFKYCFVHNYYPLALVDKSQKATNITPADLKSEQRKILESVCDESLKSIIELLHVSTVVAIGNYVEKRSREVVKHYNLTNVKVVKIPHPSPRAVGTAENWKTITIEQLKSNNILDLFK